MMVLQRKRRIALKQHKLMKVKKWIGLVAIALACEGEERGKCAEFSKNAGTCSVGQVKARKVK